MKKSFARLSTMLLSAVILLSACGGGKAADQDNEPASEQKALTELTVVLPVAGSIPKDMQQVEDAINKIAAEKIQAKVKFEHISVGDWEQQTNLMFASGEKMDLLYLSGYNFSNIVAKGQLKPLDQLLEQHGQGITDALGKDYLQATRIGGEIYGTPTVRDLAASYGLTMSKDLVDKYKIDIASIKTLDDVEAVLRKVKEGEGPTMTPLVTGAAGQSFRENYVNYDSLNDTIGVLPSYDNGLKIVNYYETKEYADFVNKIRGWYQDGLIPQDMATTQATRFDMIKAGKAFAYMAMQKPGFAESEKKLSGLELVTAELVPPVATTSTVTGAMWGIPVNSETPEKAMEFLNLMYTDKDIVNLYDWGIEGTHYVKVDGFDNVIDYPEGIDYNSVGYKMPLGWLFGNQFLSYVMNGDDPEIWSKMDQFNKSSKRSKAMGFLFDASPVKTEYAAVSNVITQYKMPLETGSVDPEQILPEFISKLKSAGIDKIIAEKQKQLDEWAKTNGVK
ncbi:ABC transporter substrate-binding protein [Paenibacillus lautus]|uniref:ABC transporter substrate-binding protein n=1 Tax=Paenibacillus lautus TaxID=1401 RepID=UPI001C10D31F|nr:ABC transporter substrate-binding protein [Paenibacillus lautus]MBU5347268.1 ABC transporter substrate-binding protein [Paenibacillus lautus]